MVTVDEKDIYGATQKQKLAVQSMVENVGAPMSVHLKNAGYSNAIAKNPHKVTVTKGFKELLDVYLPEKKLLKKHKEFINAKKIIRTYTKGDITSEIEETDGNAVKALDMAYKLRGSYATPDITNNMLVVQLSDASSSRFTPTPPALVQHDVKEVSSNPPEHATEAS